MIKLKVNLFGFYWFLSHFHRRNLGSSKTRLKAKDEDEKKAS